MAVFLICALVSMASAQAPPAFTGPMTKIRLGVSGRPDQAFLELAMARGYFAQQGIDLETVLAASGNDFIAPLALNQIQVASASPNASLFNALNRGINIRIVGDFAHLEGVDDGLVSLMVRTDLYNSGALSKPVELKGHRISMGTGRGQYSYMLVNTVLKNAGLNWSDINVQSLSFADALAAMKNKAIDAAFMIEPLITVAMRQNSAKILVKGGSVEAGAHLSILLFSPEFAKETDLATRFMIAYLRGARDYRDAFMLQKNTDDAIAILTKALSVKDPEVWKTAMPEHTDVNGVVNVDDIKRQAEVYKMLGDISGPVPDIASYVDRQFAEGAVKVLGRQ